MINIKTYQPSKFSDLVERIWILENSEEDVEVLSPPDQYINLVFPLSNSTWTHNKLKVISPQIEGIKLQSSLTKYPPNTKLIGVRFYPFGLASFANIQGKDLLNKTIGLNEITTETANKSVAHIQTSTNETEVLTNIEELLSTLFIQTNYNKTKMVRDFYQYFRWDHQAASIEEFCEEFGTNYTSLNRKFSETVGISAKRFERLIKFRKALCSLTDTSQRLTSIGIDSGYFDQSHFIREFKLFMNHSPKTYNSLIRKADKDTNIINYNFSFY